MRGAPKQDSDDTTPIAVRLLRESLDLLETDRKAAAQLIAKACAVLQPMIDGVVYGSLATWQIRKVKAHIDANLNKPITIAEVADLVGLGPSYFHRAFKKSLGVSPHVFILERRIRRAQVLMLTTKLPLSAIALASGFSDQSHLATRFHRAMGVTPRTWRRESQGRTNTSVFKGEAAWSDRRF